MKQDTFANRLKIAMERNNFKQIDLVNKTKLDKSLINKYLNGISEAGNDKLEILSKALGVNEVWLMGYDVPMVEVSREYELVESTPLTTELDVLYSKAKDKLSADDYETMKFLMEKTIKNYEESKKNQ